MLVHDFRVSSIPLKIQFSGQTDGQLYFKIIIFVSFEVMFVMVVVPFLAIVMGEEDHTLKRQSQSHPLTLILHNTPPSSKRVWHWRTLGTFVVCFLLFLIILCVCAHNNKKCPKVLCCHDITCEKLYFLQRFTSSKQPSTGFNKYSKMISFWKCHESNNLSIGLTYYIF